MRLRCALVASIMLVAVLVPVGPAQAAPPQWQTVTAQTVSGQNLLLNAVTVPAAGDVWAVGYRQSYVGGAIEFRTLIEHSTGGSTFTLVPSPDRDTAPATNFLNDVSGVSSTDIYAVGWSRPPGGASRTLIEHWNGSTWSIVTSVDPGPYGNILEGVAAIASNDVWAVGARQDGFYQAPMAQHWDGSSWTVAPVPQPAICTGHSYLTDIDAVAPHAVYATGWCGSGGDGPEQGYVVRWNGGHWVLIAGDGELPTESETFGISVLNRNNIWVVGYVRPPESSNISALVSRWNGTTWTQLPVSDPYDDANLAGVLARRGAQTWVVGAGQSPQPPFAGPASAYFAGGVGRPVPSPVPYGRFYGIASDPAGTLWAVGMQFPGQYNIPLVARMANP